MAVNDMSNGLAKADTDSGPCPSASTIRRRVGSPKACRIDPASVDRSEAAMPLLCDHADQPVEKRLPAQFPDLWSVGTFEKGPLEREHKLCSCRHVEKLGCDQR